jgi:uncharacterized membrane protein
MALLMDRTAPEPAPDARAERALFWIAFATGAGLMGAIDAIAFHHLLRWHNLYVHAGSDWRAISDGLLHVFTTALMIAGFFLLWRQRRLLTEGHARGLVLAGGLWLGMGVFQFVDGTLFHKVLALHPVREGVAAQLPYDVAWIGSALVLIAIGGALLWRSRAGRR